MKIVCIICTDQITENFAAAPCGHTFHETCLSQWLCHQKSCPQCRERCLPRNVIKLFIDTSDSSSQASLADLDPEEMKEKLSLQERQMKLKDDALSEAQKSLNEIRSEMLAWQSQYGDIRKELKEARGTNDTLRKELKQKQSECDHARVSEKEAERLRRKMSTMEGVKRILSDTKEEAESYIKTYTSATQLATVTVALKRDYEALKEKKSALQKEKDKLHQECSFLKKQCRSKNQDLESCQSRLSELERDLQEAEQEKENLHKKVELLHTALQSPDSRTALKRILESPMPENIQALRQRPVDLGASPLLASTQAKTSSSALLLEKENGARGESKVSVKVEPKLAGVKRSLNDGLDSEGFPSVLMPVNKISRTEKSSITITSGYNGLGGQSHFVVPRSKFMQPPAAKKPLKFAPRPSASFAANKSRGNKPKFFQPTLKLN